MSGNGTSLLCTNNPDSKHTNQKIASSEAAVGHLEKGCSGNPSRSECPRLAPLCSSYLAVCPLISEGNSHLLVPHGGFALNSSELTTKGKKMYLYLPASPLCLQKLSAVLVMVGIKPIKIKLQKSIKFFTLHPFVVSECCMFSSSSLPKQQSHLLFDLCKLKQVWSSLGSELWLHLLVKLFIQAIPTL